MNFQRILLMQKLRYTPFLVSWRAIPTLKALMQYLDGYDFKADILSWEKSTGLSFVDDFDITIHTITRSNKHSFPEFDEFVALHYNMKNDSNKDATALISEMCASENTSYEVYFELLDMFMEQRWQASTTDKEDYDRYFEYCNMFIRHRDDIMANPPNGSFIKESFSL